MMRALISFAICLLALNLASCQKKPTPPNESVYFGVISPKPNQTFSIRPHLIGLRLDWKTNFPKSEVETIFKKKSIPLIYWHAADVIPAEVLNGDWDDFLNRWATDVRDIQYPVFFSFPEEQVSTENAAVFRYVVSKFKEQGAGNAIWVWSFRIDGADWDHIWQAYPGDEFVDWVGVIGANIGPEWQTFEDVFYAPIQKISSHIKTKPIMIAGFGTIAEGGDLKRWVTNIPVYLQTTLKPVRAIMLSDRFDMIPLANDDPVFHNELSEILKQPVFHANIDEIQDVKPF